MLEKRKCLYTNKKEALGKKAMTFGFFFLLFLGYLMWNNFKFLKAYFGEHNRVSGYIYYVDNQWSDTNNLVKYFYQIDGIDYNGSKLVDKYRYTKIGGRIRIKHSVNHPSYHRVINFAQEQTGYLIELIGWKWIDPNYKIKLENSIYCLEKNDDPKEKEFGRYEFLRDTLVLRKFKFGEKTPNSSNSYLVNYKSREVKAIVRTGFERIDKQ